jgi:hypothetical protein
LAQITNPSQFTVDLVFDILSTLPANSSQAKFIIPNLLKCIDPHNMVNFKHTSLTYHGIIKCLFKLNTLHRLPITINIACDLLNMFNSLFDIINYTNKKEAAMDLLQLINTFPTDIRIALLTHVEQLSASVSIFLKEHMFVFLEFEESKRAHGLPPEIWRDIRSSLQLRSGSKK